MLGQMPTPLARAENMLGTETRRPLATRIARYRPASTETPNRSGSVNTKWEKRALKPSSLDMLALRAVLFFSWSEEGLTAPTGKAGEGLEPPIVSAATSTAWSVSG
jgi:hypothetical protein